FLKDALIERFGKTRSECFFRFAGLSEAIPVGTIDVDNIRDWKIEIAVIVRQPGEARAGYGDAVIRLRAADDFLLLRTAERVVVIPDQLYRGVVRFRSGVDEEYLRHFDRRDAQKLFRELNSSVVRLVRERVIVRQLG